MQCETCGCRLDPRLGRHRHANPRCDPGPEWWNRPEWQEWLRQAALRPTKTPSPIAVERRTPSTASEET